jgi:predicted O-methyltransferase YrrM
MQDVKFRLKDLIINEKIMDAVVLLEENLKDDNEFLLLRSLLREYLGDMHFACQDVRNYEGTNRFIKDITYARILSKLGYVDKARNVLNNRPLLNSSGIQVDPEGIPYSQGIVYRSFDMERLGYSNFSDFKELSENTPFFYSVADTLLILGAYQTLKKALEQKKMDSGLLDLLENLSIYDKLPPAEYLESNKSYVKSLLENVRGWLSIEEGLLLQELAKQVCDSAQIVEVGSFQGRSAICLASGINGNGTKIHSVDPHFGIEAYGKKDSFDQLQENIRARKLDSYVEYILKESLTAAKEWTKENIGLLFIDALHDYDNVKADFEAWSKYVLDGGYLLFHDSVQPGVNKLLLEILNRKNPFEPLGLRDSLFVFQKTGMVDEKKRAFFVDYLQSKGQDFENWYQRDRRNVLFFAKTLK